MSTCRLPFLTVVPRGCWMWPWNREVESPPNYQEVVDEVAEEIGRRRHLVWESSNDGLWHVVDIVTELKLYRAFPGLFPRLVGTWDLLFSIPRAVKASDTANRRAVL
jgi:hypothetical protein